MFSVCLQVGIVLLKISQCMHSWSILSNQHELWIWRYWAVRVEVSCRYNEISWELEHLLIKTYNENMITHTQKHPGSKQVFLVQAMDPYDIVAWWFYVCSMYIHIYIWFVVWSIFLFPYIGNNHSNWRSHIFQRGRLKPPSSPPETGWYPLVNFLNIQKTMENHHYFIR